MANYDRGVYEPSDEVRVFDGSEEEEDVEGSRLPLLIVLALLVLAMFGGVVWLAYTQGVARGRGETPVLTAAAGPERVAPPQGAGGNTVPYQGFKIYEQPAPPDDSADNVPPARKPAAAPAPAMAQTPKPAPPPAAAPVQPAAAAPKAPPVASKTAAASKPAAAAAKPTSAAPPKSVAALIQQANSTPVAEAPPAKPAAMSAAKQAPAPAGGPATAAPRQLGAMPPTSAPVKTAAPVVAPAAANPAASGGYVLQIGAYKSQADAETAWKVYKAKHTALLSGYSDDVQQADLGEKGTWYRLRISGFADKDMAASLCDRLKADGGVCIPGR
jgi:cell division protein FtsN